MAQRLRKTQLHTILMRSPPELSQKSRSFSAHAEADQPDAAQAALPAQRPGGLLAVLGKLLDRPAALMVLTAGILTARWIWVGGIGDFGWTYEAGWRIAHGETQYRDFISTLPPLANYTLAALLALFGDSLWWSQIHLYLWWYLSLWAGFLVGRLLVKDSALLGASMALAVVFSCPAMTLGHAYNYAATVFGSFQLLVWMSQWRRERAWKWFLLGMIGGVGMYAKQNVGLAAIASTGLLLLAARIAPMSSRPGGRAWLLWLAGIGAGFIPIAAGFSWQAGTREFSLQFFADAAEGKGGVLTILGRALPRIILQPGAPHRRLFEAGISVVLALMLATGWRKWNSQRKTPVATGSVGGFTAEASLGTFLAGVLILSLVSLVPIRAFSRFQQSLSAAYLPPVSEVAIFVLYLAAVLALLVAVFQHRRSLENATPLVMTLCILLGTATSSLVYYLRRGSRDTGSGLCVSGDGREERGGVVPFLCCRLCPGRLSFTGLRANLFEPGVSDSGDPVCRAAMPPRFCKLRSNPRQQCKPDYSRPSDSVALPGRPARCLRRAGGQECGVPVCGYLQFPRGGSVGPRMGVAPAGICGHRKIFSGACSPVVDPGWNQAVGAGPV